LRKAIELNEKNAKAHYGMGLASAKLGKLDDAIVELEKTCALTPDDAYAHYHLGMAYNQKGKKDLAIPHLRRFVELDPDAPEAPAVRSFLSRL
jgi:tetratricopeptide (TPR) repeat protein